MIKSTYTASRKPGDIISYDNLEKNFKLLIFENYPNDTTKSKERCPPEELLIEDFETSSTYSEKIVQEGNNSRSSKFQYTQKGEK